MKNEGLINDLKELKQFKMGVDPQWSRKRMERVIEFESLNGFSIDPSKQEKPKERKREGMFRGTVFCFPRIDPTNDPSL
jgi:hypothetical protein